MRRDLGNRASPVNRAHMKRPYVSPGAWGADVNKLEKVGPMFSSSVGDVVRLFLSVFKNLSHRLVVRAILY